jgi:sulfoxide reductase heme-binding subunit YedZ
MTDPSHYLFWITSRAAGTSAMVLASASVGVGLAMGGKLFKRFFGPDRLYVHQTLSLAVMVALAMHAVALLGDTYLRPTVLDVTVPFALAYRTIPTSIGIVSAWALLILGLSYYFRSKIGHRRWRAIHGWTVLAWIGGLLHTFTEGTDAGQLWFIALILLTAAPALILLLIRLGRRRSRSAHASARSDGAREHQRSDGQENDSRDRVSPPVKPVAA